MHKACRHGVVILPTKHHNWDKMGSMVSGSFRSFVESEQLGIRAVSGFPNVTTLMLTQKYGRIIINTFNSANELKDTVTVSYINSSKEVVLTVFINTRNTFVFHTLSTRTTVYRALIIVNDLLHFHSYPYAAVCMWQIILLPQHLMFYELYIQHYIKASLIPVWRSVFKVYHHVKYFIFECSVVVKWPKWKHWAARTEKEYTPLANNCLCEQSHCRNIPTAKGFLFEWGYFMLHLQAC